MGSLRHVHGGLMNVSNSSHVIFAVQVCCFSFMCILEVLSKYLLFSCPLQALFHSSPMVRFTVDDETHRKSCRSLLQCLMCSLYRVYDAISKNGLGNPASLVAKWNGKFSELLPLPGKFITLMTTSPFSGICDMMPSEKKTSPLDVLCIFIDVLRQQHCNRNPQ